MTEFYLDTANLDEINLIQKWNVMSGITTNQKIFSKEKNVDFYEHIKKILAINKDYPVSIEGPNSYRGLISFVNKLYDEHKIFGNAVIKVPMLANGDGLRAIKHIEDMGYQTNVTACMTLNQAVLAALAGASYVSLFYNRMIDWYNETHNALHQYAGKEYALKTIRLFQEFIDENPVGTRLIVGSIRDRTDIEDILTSKPDIITIPYKIMKDMPQNDMTDKTLKDFEEAFNDY